MPAARVSTTRKQQGHMSQVFATMAESSEVKSLTPQPSDPLDPSTFVFPEQATTVTIEFCDRVRPSLILSIVLSQYNFLTVSLVSLF